jgi:hypothetical protein
MTALGNGGVTGGTAANRCRNACDAWWSLWRPCAVAYVCCCACLCRKAPSELWLGHTWIYWHAPFSRGWLAIIAAWLACVHACCVHPEQLAVLGCGCALVPSGAIGCCRSVYGSCCSTPQPPHDASVNVHASSKPPAPLGAGTYEWCLAGGMCAHTLSVHTRTCLQLPYHLLHTLFACESRGKAHPLCMYSLGTTVHSRAPGVAVLALYLSA